MPARPTVAALVAAVLGLGVAGCGGGGGIDVTEPATALVIGDSIAFQSATELDTALRDAGWVPVLQAYPGASITESVAGPWADRVRDLVKVAEPDVVVIELGTNGCGECPAIARGVDRLMEALDGVEGVFWCNVKTYSPIPADADAINAALDEATERYDNLEILDFDGHFEGRRRLLDPDRIHLSERGQDEFARFVVDALPDLD